MSMHLETLNLLPPERLRALRREYFTRLAALGVGALGIVGIGSGALLIPSYLYVHEQTRLAETQLAALAKSEDTTNDKETKQRLAALTEEAASLSRLATTTSAGGTLRAVLAVPRPGISLSGLTLTPSSGNIPGKVALRGIAASRGALQEYARVLGTLPFVKTVDLPISVYAQEADIPFSISLMGPLLP
jgi:hypothetical protein